MTKLVSPLVTFEYAGRRVVTEEEARRYANDLSQANCEFVNLSAREHFDEKYDHFTEGNSLTWRDSCERLERENGKLREACGKLRAENESLRATTFVMAPLYDSPLHAGNLRRDIDRHTRLGEKLEKRVNEIEVELAEQNLRVSELEKE